MSRKLCRKCLECRTKFDKALKKRSFLSIFLYCTQNSSHKYINICLICRFRISFREVNTLGCVASGMGKNQQIRQISATSLMSGCASLCDIILTILDLRRCLQSMHTYLKLFFVCDHCQNLRYDGSLGQAFFVIY